MQLSELDLGIEQENETKGPEFPYIFLKESLTNAQVSFLLEITGQEYLNEGNSIPFYIKVSEELVDIGRFDISDIRCVSKFKFMGYTPLLALGEDVEYVDLTDTVQMKKMVKLSKEF